MGLELGETPLLALLPRSLGRAVGCRSSWEHRCSPWSWDSSSEDFLAASVLPGLGALPCPSSLPFQSAEGCPHLMLQHESSYA